MKAAIAAKNKMKSDADEHIEANAAKWKEKNDLLKTGNRELRAKYEKLKKDIHEFATKYEKLKAQYEKEHNELKEIKRTMGPSFRSGPFMERL